MSSSLLSVLIAVLVSLAATLRHLRERMGMGMRMRMRMRMRACFRQITWDVGSNIIDSFVSATKSSPLDYSSVWPQGARFKSIDRDSNVQVHWHT